MKNFKKVLALVLVLATLMGFATVAGAAYKDEKDINADYSEAVKVLNLIETMQGYPDGNFKPTATITREEAAKLIAIFDNKDSDIKTYYTSVNPFADEKGRWGESYVGYGYRAGIIAGMNATTFAPTANVTGTQFLKMALVTLGYDQEAEGFVGASWAVNVLALAKKLGLTDNLADGWKADAALTRQEAAQILLDTLQCETVEYGTEFKAPKNPVWATSTNGDKSWTGYWLDGKFYITVAGACTTGNKLYKDFKLDKVSSTDAFFRPQTKWILDGNKNKTVEVMDAPKATFTKQFSVCDLLVALGIEETNRKTEIAIDAVYNNGVLDETAPFVTALNNSDCQGTQKGKYQYNKTDDEFKLVDDNYTLTWNHGYSHCTDAKNAKQGAQGTLTQVFYVGKVDNVKHYIVVSIETWLGKVTSVDTSSTSRDKHTNAADAVAITPYLNDYSTDEGHELQENYASYCKAGNRTGHCDVLDDYSTKTKTVNNERVEYNEVSFDDATGLAKNDYVLFNFSFRRVNDGENADYQGVQDVEVTEGKEGRLNGFKYDTVATNPSETRVDGEFIKDAVHFHLNYNTSKSTEYGTYTFFYDAYGNVIGMKDAADTSKYGVIDIAWMTFENKGTAVLNADVVALDAKTTTGTIKKFASIDNYIDEKAENSIADDSAAATKDNKLAYYVAEALYQYTNGESRKDFADVYDHLFKVDTNKDGQFKITVDADTVYAADAKITKNKPILTAKTRDLQATAISYVTTSETQFLVHKMDGTYVSYTGYKNTESLVADYCEVIPNADNANVADVVYLYENVHFTNSKVVAYVAKSADKYGVEVKEDGDTYYVLTAYIDGKATEVYVSEADMLAYFDYNTANNKFHKGFFELQYVDIDEITTVTPTKFPTDYAGEAHFTGSKEYLTKLSKVVYFNGEVLKISNVEAYSLADGCALYGVYDDKVVEMTAAEIEARYEKTVEGDASAYSVWFSLNDDDQVTAIYMNLPITD